MPKKKKTTKTTVSSTKVFDVARPGKVAANATSRPVIVGHKPLVKDPMMSPDQGDNRTLMDGKNKVNIEPSKEAAASAPAADQALAPTPVESVPQPTSQEKPLPQKAVVDVSSVILGDSVQVEPPKATEAPSAIEAADVSEEPDTALPAAPVVPSKPASPETPPPRVSAPANGQLAGSTGIIYDESPTEQPPKMPENANTEPLPVLPEEQTPPPKVQVVVSHHKPRASTGTALGWVLFAVLLAAIILDVLLDAGIITLGVPHTHFF